MTMQECKIDIFEAIFKITSFKPKLQNQEEKICSNNLKTLKMLHTFMSMCKWEEAEQNLEQHVNKAASSCVHTLLDSFEAYFSHHQAAE